MAAIPKNFLIGEASGGGLPAGYRLRFCRHYIFSQLLSSFYAVQHPYGRSRTEPSPTTASIPPATVSAMSHIAGQNKKGRRGDPLSGKEWSEVRRPSAMQVAQILDFLMCVELFLHDPTAVSGIPATNRN